MIELKIVLPLQSIREDQLDKIHKVFSGFVLKWKFEDFGLCVFQTEIQERKANAVDVELGLKCYKVSFTCNMELETDDERRFFWPTSDTENRYEWEEFEFYELRKLYLALVLAIVLSHPEFSIGNAPIELFINEKLFSRELYMDYNIHNDAYDSFPNVYSASITLQAAFDWLIEKTSQFDTNQKPINAISALSYVLNRELREILIYTSIGLESIYVPENRNERQRLKTRIKLLFPHLDIEASINDMYTFRSKFVHGEISMGIWSLMEPNISSDEAKLEKTAQFAAAILVESIRILISKNATGIKFSEITEYALEN
ncbi:MAG: hypothetical protein IKC28_03765 [Clostridia bacterium]|nr:hypothetical protein [Clostridia bacterium]